MTIIEVWTGGDIGEARDKAQAAFPDAEVHVFTHTDRRFRRDILAAEISGTGAACDCPAPGQNPMEVPT